MEGDGEDPEDEEEVVLDVPLDRVRAVAREEIEEALRAGPSPAYSQRDARDQARQAAREVSVRSVREALASPDFETRVARIEKRATEGATRAAAQHVTPYLDALHLRQRGLEERTRRVETSFQDLAQRLDAVERERQRDGSSVKEAPESAANEEPGASASPSRPEDEPSEIVGVCKACGTGYEPAEKAMGFRRCVECGDEISWL